MAPNQVWIQLASPKDQTDEFCEKQCDRANNMLKRLHDGKELSHVFMFDRESRLYSYGNGMGERVLSDDGNYFNLDYLGRDFEVDAATSANAHHHPQKTD